MGALTPSVQGPHPRAQDAESLARKVGLSLHGVDEGRREHLERRVCKSTLQKWGVHLQLLMHMHSTHALHMQSGHAFGRPADNLTLGGVHVLEAVQLRQDDVL